MKKTLLALVLLVASFTTSASAQSVSVSVNLKTMFTTPEQGTSQVCISLAYPGSTTFPSPPRVIGTGVLVPVNTQCQSPNNGVVSFLLYGNDVITVGGQAGVTFYIVEFFDSGNFVSGANYTINTADSPVDLSVKVPISVPPVVAAPTGDGTYARKDGGNQPFTGPIQAPSAAITGALTAGSSSVSGTLTTQNANGDLWIGNGPGQYSSLANCIAAIPGTGGTCHVPNGWTDPTWTSNLTIGTSNTSIVLHGCATFPMSTFILTKPINVNNVAIRGTILAQRDLNTANCARFVSTGTSTPIVMGGAGFSSGVYLSDFFVDITGAGSSVHGIDLLGVDPGHVYRVIVGGASSGSQIGLNMDGQFAGSSATTQNVIVDSFGASGGGVTTAIRCQNGCNYNVFNNLFPSINSTGIGLDLECVSGAGAIGNIGSMDFEILGTGIQFGNCSAISGNRFTLGLSGNSNTTDAIFGASSKNNFINFVGVDNTFGPKITDNSPIGTNGWKVAAVPDPLCITGSSGAVTGTSSDVALFTCTIPPNWLGPGRGIEVAATFFHSTGTASTTYKLKAGSTTMNSQSSTGVSGLSPGGGNLVREELKYYIYNSQGTQGTQFGWTENFVASHNVTNVILPDIGIGGYNSSIDFTQSQTITFTFNVANTDAVTPESFRLRLLQ